MKYLLQFSGVERLWCVTLLALIPMLNVTYTSFVAPNEEPKWFILLMCAALLCGYMLFKLFQRKPLYVHIKYSVFSLALVLFYFLIGIGVLNAPSFDNGLIRFSFWLSSLAVWLLAAYITTQKNVNYGVIFMLILIAAVVFSLHYWVYYIFQYGTPGYDALVQFSPIGHVNFTSDVLIMLLPAVVWVLIKYHSYIVRLAALFACTSLLAALLNGASRGALMGLILGMLVLFLIAVLYVLKHNITYSRIARYKMSVCAVALVLLAFFVLYQCLPHHLRSLERLNSSVMATLDAKPVEAINEHVLQPPLARLWNKLRPILGNRTPIYASTTAMIMDAPWLGHGTGSFAAIYPLFSHKYPQFLDPLSTLHTFTSDPHNIFLQIVAQNGFIAGVLFMFLLFSLWFQLVSALLKEWDGWVATGVVSCSAIIIDAMFNQMFFNPASMFTFALLGGCWWGRTCMYRSNGSVIFKHQLQWVFNITMLWRALFAVILMLVLFCLFVLPMRWLVSEYYVGMAMKQVSIKNLVESNRLYDEALDWDQYNIYALFYKARALYIQGRYRDSMMYLKRLQKSLPYSIQVLNMLAVNYMRTGQWFAAGEVLNLALAVYPQNSLLQKNLRTVQSVLLERSGALE